MEYSPQELAELRLNAEIKRQVARHVPQGTWTRMENRALENHPPLFRSTVPVPEAVKNIGVKIIQSRMPKRKRHVLP
jgi:hypothetical protein